MAGFLTDIKKLFPCVVVVAAALFLAGCSSAPPQQPASPAPEPEIEAPFEEDDETVTETGLETPFEEPVQREVRDRTVKVSDTPQQYVDVYASGGWDWPPERNISIKRAAPLKLAAEAVPVTTVSPASSSSTEEATEVEYREARGFRVQIANVTSQAKANSIVEKAKELFSPVYLEYQSPNYKVRVGDFRMRSAADAIADSARANGFRGAWVVPAKILVPR